MCHSLEQEKNSAALTIGEQQDSMCTAFTPPPIPVIAFKFCTLSPNWLHLRSVPTKTGTPIGHDPQQELPHITPC